MKALVLVCLLAGCVTPLATDGRSCPCDDDHVCCVTGGSVARCVRREDFGKLACMADAGAVDAAPLDAAVDVVVDAAPDLGPGLDLAADAAGVDLPPAAPRCQNGGGALGGTYFAGDNFKGISFHRSEPALVFESFSFLSDQLSGPSQSFTAVFSGALVPEITDRHSFLVTSNGAVRVWIGGELVIDAWEWPCCPRGLSAGLTLEQGRRYEVLIEYFGVDQATKLAIYWRTSKSPGWTAIPPCALFEKESGPSACPASFGDCLPTGSPSCETQPRNGIQATYYQTADFTGAGHIQHENFVSSGWLATNAPPDARSVRWEADLVAPTTGRYTLYLAARGHTRVTLAGRTLLETGAMPPLQEVERPVDLGMKELNRLLIEQSIGDFGFWIRLRWKSEGVPRATIPRCRFYLPPSPPSVYDGGQSGGDTG